jgi:hypothetical protein
MTMNRMKLIRQWLIIVESYYWVRATLIIWPKYYTAVKTEEDGDVRIVEELMQLFLAIFVCAGLVFSYFGKHLKYTYVKWLLVI